MLNLEENHKEHLQLLSNQSESERDFKDYLDNVSSFIMNTLYFDDRKEKRQYPKDTGNNQYLYDNLPSSDQQAVACLINLLLESCKMKLNNDDFAKEVTSFGFNDNQLKMLTEHYNYHKDAINQYLILKGISFAEYFDLNWRFEVQVASRASLKQSIPLVTMDLAVTYKEFENIASEKKNIIKHISLQTDPNNLNYLVQELEMALQEGRSRHIKNVSKIAK